MTESKMNHSTEAKLFSPTQLGAISLSHRVIHGPTTRLRANRRNAPLTPYVRDAFWGGDERNYTDFPILEDTSV